MEGGTPLGDYQEFYTQAEDDPQADMSLPAVEFLKRCDYRQYEISNFCRKGNVSRHNLKYWSGGAYLGFGPDASSDFGGQRFACVRSLKQYIDGIAAGG